MSDTPRTNAAFINAVADEGTKTEAVEWLQKTWDEKCQLQRECAELRKKLDNMNTVIAKQTNALTHARGALTRISEYDAFGGHQGAMFLARGAIGQIDETMKAEPPL